MKTWFAAAWLVVPLTAHAQTAVSPAQFEDFFSGRGSLSLPPPVATPAAAPVARPAAAPARKLKYTIVKVYPHDVAAFTEGLFFHEGFLYESVGMEGQSEVRKVDLKSGGVVQSAVSPNKVFGEGVALVGGKLIQLTYTEGRAFVYDFATMRLTGEFHYSGEGWGLTEDGKNLIMSNGSDLLTFRDPATFAARRRVRVMLDGTPVNNINELEYVDGSIWANVWKEDRILRIDAASGRVTGVLDMTGLLGSGVQLPEPVEDVLNGIAYDPASGHFFVTGKCWPSLFEIKIDD
jgi:glutaminyl-peptide cyclotransferase